LHPPVDITIEEAWVSCDGWAGVGALILMFVLDLLSCLRVIVLFFMVRLVSPSVFAVLILQPVSYV